jgi:hypothetical protein
MTGNKLFEWFGDDIMKSSALTYVTGVSDSIQGFQESLNTCFVTLPPGVTARQTADVARLWLEKHPERRHYSAFSLVYNALVDAWPCPPK